MSTPKKPRAMWGINLEQMTDEQLHRLLNHTRDSDLRLLPQDEFDALTTELKLRYGAAVAVLDQQAQWFRERGEEPPGKQAV